MKLYIKELMISIPLLLIIQSCSYIDTVKRANLNEEIKGTDAYYDNKCLIAEECVRVSAKVIMPLKGTPDELLIAVVVDGDDRSRVIDAEVINFTQDQNEKVSYFFFDLPVGNYTAYALNMPKQNSSLKDANLSILAKGSGTITKDDLKPYQNAIALDDVYIEEAHSDEIFPYSLAFMRNKIGGTQQRVGYFEDNVSLDDPVFSHQVAMEGLYYPDSFSKKSRGIYRLKPQYKEGSIPLILVHGMAGTPRDWKYMLTHLDLTHFTPYVVYYPSGEDFTKLSAQFNAWILSDKIFGKGPGVIIAHSFGGIIVRDAFNLQQKDSRKNSGLFISIATPYGGDEKAAKGVENAPYIIPAWRSIASNSTYIRNLFRDRLSNDGDFELIFTYNNNEDGLSGDGRVPLKSQLRVEAQREATRMRGFNEDHISILNSKEATDYINTLLQQFAKEHIDQK